MPDEPAWALGLSRVETRYYAGARHELLNETNRDEVTADVLGWVGAWREVRAVRSNASRRNAEAADRPFALPSAAALTITPWGS